MAGARQAAKNLADKALGGSPRRGSQGSSSRGKKSSSKPTGKSKITGEDKLKGKGELHANKARQDQEAIERAVKTVLRAIGWKKILYGFAAVFAITLLSIPLFSAGAVAQGTLEDIRSILPWSATDEDSELTDEDKSAISEAMQEAGKDIDGQRLLALTECIKGKNGSTDPILSRIAVNSEPGTDPRFIEAWSLYVASSPEARGAVIAHHPELQDTASGEVPMSAEQIKASHYRVYTKQEVIQLWNYYTQRGYFDPVEFVHWIAPNSQPELFRTQIPAVMWGLGQRGVVDISNEEFLDRITEVCYPEGL